MKIRLSAVLIISLMVAGIACAHEPVRLDASSDAAAEASWKKMIESVSAAEKRKLVVAMLQINLAGVNSAYEVAGNPELQNLGIARIKDKVAGLSADEIIALGNRTSGVQVQSVQ